MYPLFSSNSFPLDSPVVHAHALSTSTNTNINHTSLDLVGNVDAGLQSGRALSVECSDSCILGEASNKGSSTKLGSTSARSKHVADGDILNEGRVDLGTLDNGLQDAGKEIACGCVLEGSLAALGEGGTAGSGDDDLLRYPCEYLFTCKISNARKNKRGVCLWQSVHRRGASQAASRGHQPWGCQRSGLRSEKFVRQLE